jgi:hypothetical protein
MWLLATFVGITVQILSYEENAMKILCTEKDFFIIEKTQTVIPDTKPSHGPGFTNAEISSSR